MNISKAAKLSGLTVKTVRYYADIKMVEPARKVQSGYRDYSSDDVSKLNFIGKRGASILVLMNAESFFLYIRIKIDLVRK